jgi:hypothetical protein
LSRRTEIKAAIAAHNRDDRQKLLLPPDAARLLALMFPRGTVCRRSVPSLAAEGFDRRTLPHLLESLIDVGFLSKEPGRRGFIGTYYLHLPPRRRR